MTSTWSPPATVRTGPFSSSTAATEARRVQGLDAEVVQMPSGAWYLTQRRERPVRCGDGNCWVQTWSSTGFCLPHLEARGYAVG